MDVVQALETGVGAKSESGKFQSIQNRVFQYLLNEVSVEGVDSRETRARRVTDLAFSSPLFMAEDSFYRSRLIEQFTCCPDIRQSLAKIAAVFEGQVRRVGEELADDLNKDTIRNIYEVAREKVAIAGRLSESAKVLRGQDFLRVVDLVTDISTAIKEGGTRFEGGDLGNLIIPMAELAICILGTLNLSSQSYLSKEKAINVARAIQGNDIDSARETLKLRIDPIELRARVEAALGGNSFYSFHRALRILGLGDGDEGEEELKRLVSKGEIRAFRDEDKMKFKLVDLIRFKVSEQCV